MDRSARICSILPANLAIIALAGCSFSSANVAVAQDGDDFLQPALAAISVSDVDRSIVWYADVLGFELIQRTDYPDDGTIIAFVGNSSYRLELVQRRGSVPFNAPDSRNPASRQGVGKLAFQTSVIALYQQRAVDAGATFINPVRQNRVTGACFLTMLDPDSVWIQLVGPCPEQDTP